MDVSEAQEAKQLRDENTKLRKLVADLSLDKEDAAVGDRKKRMELVALKAAVGQDAGGVRLQRAAGVRADDDGGSELPLPDAGARMSRCARELVELAREKPRFGYRRLHVLLRPIAESR